MSFFDDLSSVVVTKEMLIAANDAVVERGQATIAEGRKPEFIDVFFAVRELLGEDMERKVLQAVIFRMQALAELVRKQSIGRWSVEVEGQAFSLVQEAVFAAAATTPLRADDHRFFFDPGEFVRIALELSEQEGSA